MTGRHLFIPLLAVLCAALVWEATRASSELRASRIVRAVALTTPAGAQDPAAQAILRHNLGLALEATRLEPDSLAAQQALGSIYLLLGRADEATAAYRRALALQPAAEIYVDLGHAALLGGDIAAAKADYARAVALDTRLTSQIPPAAR